MSIVQPENGLPERRMITADSFRALRLKLITGGRQAAALDIGPPDPPVLAVPDAQPPTVTVEAPERLEPLPEPDQGLAEPDPVAASPISEAAVTVAEIDIPADVPAPEPVRQFEPPAEAGDIFAAESVQPPPPETAERPAVAGEAAERPTQVSLPMRPGNPGFIERRVLEKPQAENPEAGERAHALLDIMAMPTEGSLPQERALANDTLLRLIPRMPLKSLRHLAERVCLMEAPSQMLLRRLINDPRIEVSGPLLEHAMTVDDSDLIGVANGHNPAKLKLIARRRIISPALAEALIQSNDVETLTNLVRNAGASFSIESMWRLTRFAAAHPVLQAPLVTRQDTPSPIAFQLFWRLPSELRRYVLSRFLTDSETITKILTMNREDDGAADRKYADLSLLSKLDGAAPDEAGKILSRLTHVSTETGARIADDSGGEALTVALKAAGLTRAQFAGIVEKRPDAEALKAIFETLSFNKARVLLTYWDWAAKRTGPYARTAAS